MLVNFRKLLLSNATLEMSRDMYFYRSVLMLLQIFQDTGSATNHIEHHEIPRSTSHIENLKENLEMLKQNYAGNAKKHKLETQITQVTEKNIVPTKRMHDVETFSKIFKGTFEAVKKKLEDFKDNFCQPQIPSFCSSKILKSDVEDLKLQMHEIRDSVADLDLKVQLQEKKAVDGKMI